MDLIQLYSATQRVVASLKTSGLMPALKDYRASLRGEGDRSAGRAGLVRASDEYIEQTLLYGDSEKAVVELLHLSQLGTASFWLDLTSDSRSIEVRKAQSVSAYSKMMFASSHLPNLLSLVRESSAIENLRADSADSGSLVLRLYDSLESASSPDRIARLIDAVDMLYMACASVSDIPNKPLRLMSVSGVAVRSVVFHGSIQAINATREVISHLNRIAEESHRHDNYSVDEIAASMPYLDALAELAKKDVIDGDVAATASRNARDSAIMLLECGAQLVEDSNDSDTALSDSVIARLDADAKTFDTVDSKINDSIAERYDAAYQRERDNLINEAVAGEARPATRKTTRGERRASPDLPRVQPRNDNIDDLIVDLNRLYGERP